jgi:hypothetical protein
MKNHCCLQVEVTLNATPEQWLAGCEQAVPAMRALPGLVWKLWLEPSDGKAGGLYLFESLAAAAAYAEGPVVAGLRASPAVRDVTVRLLPLVDALSRQTFGLAAQATAA